MKIKYFTLVVFFLSLLTIAKSQSLIKSSQTSHYTYIYKISDREAKRVYSRGFQILNNSYFHTVVDSFPTGTDYHGNLEPGHYLKAYTEDSGLNVKVSQVPNFDVRILNNNTDLCIQVFDLQGNLINDAKVRIGMRRISFDEKTGTYRLKRSNREGILHVKHKGVSGYYDLSRQFNNSFFNRNISPVVNSFPLRVVWRPARYFVRLPFDGMISLLKRNSFGTIAETHSFLWRIRVFGLYYLIDEAIELFYDIEDFFIEKIFFGLFDKSYNGYLVFNKPKYRPGETVKLKAFVVDKRGRPLKKELSLYVLIDGKSQKLSDITPYTKGGYKHEFYLHDTLNLKLDRKYNVYLAYNKNRVIRGSFHYEDYELSKKELSLRTLSHNHYKGRDFKLFITGRDVNQLNILDGRLEVIITPKKISELFEEKVFIPDTLFYSEIPLDPAKETELHINDSNFPKANMSYNIKVTLLTSDNQRHVKNKDVRYYHKKEEIELELLNDSILVNYLKNGLRTESQVSVFAYDNFGNELFLKKITTPATFPYNSFYNTYKAKTNNISEEIILSYQPSLIQPKAYRTHNSLSISVENPRNLDFTYNIYRKNKEVARGHGKTLDTLIKASRRHDYVISIRYVWGGRVSKENIRATYRDKKLNIKVKKPNLVFPGKNTDIEVLVTDQKGQPVDGVDLTAYSITSKFDYSPPAIPDFSRTFRSKKIINNFSISEFSENSYNTLELDYYFWKSLANIDTMEYYRFLFPEKGVYINSFNTPDGITQFAPFVFINGTLQPVHVIYVDNIPVYFSWSTNLRPYSFKIRPGYRKINIRTSDYLIKLNLINFSKGEKTIISVNPDISNSLMEVEKMQPYLSKSERDILSRYVFPYKYSFGDRYAYLVNRNKIHFLKPEVRRWNMRHATHYAGPVHGTTRFNLMRRYSHRFNHEPYFEYGFKPNLIQMRCINPDLYPMHLYNKGSKVRLNEYVLTQEKIQNIWKRHIEKSRYLSSSMPYPAYTSKGYGSLHFNISKQKSKKEAFPVNSILIKHDNHDFIRIYPGRFRVMNQLKEGKYALILAYPDDKYFILENINIWPDGQKHLNIKDPELISKRALSAIVSEILNEDALKQYWKWLREEKTDVSLISNIFYEKVTESKSGLKVKGYVYCVEDGSAIPGASVIIKGTTSGTITDINGYYSLKIPVGSNTLTFSFVGYETKNVTIDGRSYINAQLSPFVFALDEVVSVGYGTQRRVSGRGRVTPKAPRIRDVVIEDYSGLLEGRVPGQSAFYGADEIVVRGVSSLDSSSEPLIIIDGVVYLGSLSNINPDFIQNITILDSSEAVALYGSRAAAGAILIATSGGTVTDSDSKLLQQPEFDKDFIESAMSASIRQNFSDYAFWQPSLKTNEKGIATFNVTFPDDITSWQTHYLAMNTNKQSGQTSTITNSYKPLMAQLSLPRFLVKSDTANVIGRISNYLMDSIMVTSSLKINENTIFAKSRYCQNVIVDTIKVVGATDSINVRYTIEAENGFYDGEQRSIKVNPAGLDESVGQFFVLDKDTIIEFDFIDDTKTAMIYAQADVLNVLSLELERLIRYRHLCNEQVASRLKALLMQKAISDFKEESFGLDRNVNRAIKRLLDGRNEDGLWGWWKSSGTSYWISNHVIDALIKAENKGYDANLDKTTIYEKYVWYLNQNIPISHKLRIIYTLKNLDSEINLSEKIDELLINEKLSFNQMLQAYEIKQFFDENINIDTLLTYKNETLFGNVFFSSDENDYDVTDNNVQNTLIMYRILRNSEKDYDKLLALIRNYFFEVKKEGSWRNTYESSLIMEAILPDLLNGGFVKKPKLKFRGDIEKTVTEFPFELEVSASSKFQIEKTGTYPVYITGYQQFWNPNPLTKTNDFSISTSFKGIEDDFLIAGRQVKLVAKVRLEKDAEYVMITVPIPAGCSYDKKPSRLENESHREHFRNETVIYSEKLKAGKYVFEIGLIPRYTGNYVLNPAKIELMYFPVFNANNEIKRIEIK